MMNAVCKNHIGNRHYAVLQCASGFYTVDVCLCRSNIQPCVIALRSVVGNLGTKAENIFGNGLAVQNYCVRHTACCICYIAKYRRFTIVNRIGIVNGDIINIHNIPAVVRLVLIIIIIVSSTVTIRNIELNDVSLMQVQSLICAEINRKIVPTGFFILVHETSGGNNSISQCIRDRTAGLYVFAIVILNKWVYSIANPSGYILIGNIDPHTEFGGIFKGLNITGILK